MEKEIWYKITDNGHFVSNFLRFKRVSIVRSRNNKIINEEKHYILKQNLGLNGYYTVYVSGSNKLVHRLIAEAFIPNPDNKPHINHKNAIRTDNRVENLEWCTPLENVRHSLSLNIRKLPMGQNHRKAKLKDSDVLKIRELHKLGMGSKSISFLYPVMQCSISNIISRKTWKHI